ncbi:efflux RND transporter periplasmic adaptor subunit [Roseateles amylovorans]|uniref:Efflux RND transporter periplasmic adaptor subunit n=1 Tax=Roseateles amylovorans TaxID=2978473 RepID=A0ABY6B0V4_9BURK|nr:efflux RND transporter periplasmic adaptor subunit [Roseateles amylovorans]UXH78309.1 efflux RND transporter periplasmic adaptor subunit [Roseateles amylovorans]
MAGPFFERKSVSGALLALTLAACGPQQQQQPQGGPPPVSVAPALQREVQEFDEFTARLEAPDTVEIRARVAGTLDKVHFREGQLVKKGDPLFTIDPRPFAAEVARAEAQVAAARTAADLSKSDLGRAEKLVAIQGVSQQEIDQLKSAVRNGDANIKAAEAALVQARLNLEFTQVKAPVTGRSSRANVTPGNLVTIGDPVLTTIVSSDRVYAYFDASEATFLKYVQATRAGNMPSQRTQPNKVLLGLANEQGYPHEGRMDFVDNRLNPATASIRGRAVFDNKDGYFTPGLFARVKLVGSGAYNAVLVPERAISTDQSRKLVLIVGPNNIVQPRPVKPGAQFDGFRAVEGVKPGELVIVDGLQHAMPGAPVTPQTVKLDDKGHALPAPPAAGASK